MDSRRIRNLRNSFDKNIVDKQVDKFFETGRRFVDGVSGARPGKRRNSDFQGITSKSVKKVGRSRMFYLSNSAKSQLMAWGIL